jgi:signal transduction histidine kinase
MTNSAQRDTSEQATIIQQWLIFRPIETASYATLVIGYVMSILGTQRLTLLNFTAATILNLLAGLLFWRLNAARGISEGQRTVILIVLSVLAFLNGLLTAGGLWFNFLFYFIAVGNYFFYLPLRKALIASTLLFLGVCLTFILIDGWSDFHRDVITVFAGFIFVGAFSLSNRLLNSEREHSSQLFHELEISKGELEQAHTQLQQYARELEELAITRERTRMAREIHDTLGHYLTIITIQLETISKLQKRDAISALAEIEEARRVAAQCMQEVRNAVAALRPTSIANLDLKQALAQLAHEFRSVAPDSELTLDLETDLPAHSAELQLALYRAAQEALTNVRKHAQASRVLLRLRYENEFLELMVRDNGQGAPFQASLSHNGGFGLTGLRERIELLGGQVTHGPVEPSGYRVLVRIHVPQTQIQEKDGKTVASAIEVQEETV